MAHNAETIRLLDQLGLRYGVGGSKDPKVLRAREIFHKFLVLNSKRLTEELNQELQDMLIMAEQAKKQANEFLSDNHLTATEFEPSWSEHFMCLELKSKINGQPIANQDQHYLSYEGREINIRVMGQNSNNNFNPDDVLKMLETKKQAALDLNPNIEPKLESLLKAFNKERQALIENFYKRPLAEILEQVVRLNQELLILLAVELIRQKLGKPNYNPSENQIRTMIGKIEKKETANVSNNRRAIKIVAYPQAVSDTDDVSQWMLSTNIPKGDISSDERALKVHRVPNPWDVTQTVCRIKGENLLSATKHAEVYRSASVAQLSEDKIVRGLGSDEQKNLHNLIIETARDQLIEKLNRGEEIDWAKVFPTKTLYLTLLTPIADKEASSKSFLVKQLPSKVQDTLVKGNEAEQLLSLVSALKNVEGKQLKFSALDIKFILEHVPADKVPDLQTHLTALHIEHDFFFSNFTVNTFQKIDLGKVKTCVENNQLHNTEGIEYLDRHLINFFEKQYHGLGPVIKNILYANNGSKREWAAIRKDLLNTLPKDPDNLVHKILNLYMQLGDYFDSQDDRNASFSDIFGFGSKKTNSMIVESYFAAAIEVQLAALMGFDIRTTCKSGKDRTGLFLAILEASAGPPEKFRINLCRALKYSDIKELIEQNRPGCRGVQIDADVMDDLRTYAGVGLDGDADEFGKLLSEWESRAVGSIPKRVYGNDAVLREYSRVNKATAGAAALDKDLEADVPTSGAAAMVVSAPITANKRKPPPPPQRAPQAEFLPMQNKPKPLPPQPQFLTTPNQLKPSTAKAPPIPPKPIGPKKPAVAETLKAIEENVKTGELKIDPNTLTTVKDKIKFFDKGHNNSKT